MMRTFHFWTHKYLEHSARSKSNPQEAEMVVRCASWIVSNGLQPEKITIIAMYQGQVCGLRSQSPSASVFNVCYKVAKCKALLQDHNLKDIDVQTVGR